MGGIAAGLCTRSCKCSPDLMLTERLILDRADIEQEVNGLYSFDRKEKLEAKKVKEIIEEVQKVYHSKH